MKHTALRFAAFRRINVWFVLAACSGIGVLPAHAAGSQPGSDTGALSMYTLKLINYTHSRIDSFSIAPAGTDHWTSVDFRTPMRASPFGYELAATLQIHDDNGCLRDLRTVMSDGHRFFTRHFDLCHVHAYLPGVRFAKDHPGS